MSGPSEPTLAGKVALVTGASRGIGRAVAVQLAREGAAVAVTSRDPVACAETLAEIAAAGPPGLAVGLEAREVASIRAAVDRVERELGPIDILVNNAGATRHRLALEMSEDDWDFVVDTNLRGAFFVAQAVGRGMVARGSGRIVNVASMAAFRAFPERTHYNASKAGLVMLTKSLAVEWGPYGVTVNAVAPTFVETELGALTLAQPGRREAITARIPLGRLPTPSEVAAAVSFLVSPAAAAINGAVLPIDGGFGAA